MDRAMVMVVVVEVTDHAVVMVVGVMEVPDYLVVKAVGVVVEMTDHASNPASQQKYKTLGSLII